MPCVKSRALSVPVRLAAAASCHAVLAQGDVRLEDDLRLAAGGVDRQRGIDELGRRIHLVTGGLSRLCRRQERRRAGKAGKKRPAEICFSGVSCYFSFLRHGKRLDCLYNPICIRMAILLRNCVQ